MIPGLQYVSGYLDDAEQHALLETVSELDWQEAGGRRIQFYGHWYHHAKGGVYRVGDLPAWAASLAERLGVSPPGEWSIDEAETGQALALPTAG